MAKVGFNKRELNAALKALNPEAYRRAAISTVNELVKSAKSETDKAIRAVYTIKQKDLKPYLGVRLASKNSKQPEAEVVITGRPIRLMKFISSSSLRTGINRPKRGKNRNYKRSMVSVKVKKNVGTKKLRHSFVAMTSSGHMGIFQRERGKSRHKKVSKYGKSYYSELPIDELFTTWPVKMFEKEGEKAVEKLVHEKMQPRFEHHLAYWQKRLKG